MSKHNYNKWLSYIDLDYPDQDSRDYVSLFRWKLVQYLMTNSIYTKTG